MWRYTHTLYIHILHSVHLYILYSPRKYKKIVNEYVILKLTEETNGIKNVQSKQKQGASLVAQWLRICLPMQGTWAQALVWEDPTCHRATKPMRHNYWACALEPMSHNYWAHTPQILKPMRPEPMLCNKRSYHNEKPAHCNEE